MMFAAMPLSHSHIWAAIDALASRLNTTPSGLARLAGLDSTSFNKSKRLSAENPPRPRWPSTESLAKLLEATGMRFSEFAHLAEGDDGGQGIPLIGFAQAGSDGYFDDSGFPLGQGWDEVSFPGAGKGLYALEISGDSMMPVYRDGDRIVVSPSASASLRRGDRVVVKTHAGEVMAKQLGRMTAQRIELKSFNPAFEDRGFALSEIAFVHRIIWASQ